MTKRLLFLTALAMAGGCSQKQPTQTLPSLERSSAASFLCLAPGSLGRDIDSCPDFDVNDQEERHLYAMVTQTGRGEVAAVDLSLALPIDEDPSVPGYEFLPVGAFPEDLASTPGGVATFVSVHEDPNKNGLIALPSTCISPPTANELPRSLTSYPACALQVAPGRMTILIDPPDAGGNLRPACSAPYDTVTGTTADPLAVSGTTCPAADLGLERVSRGRRKLLVALPDLGGLALIDAQWLLHQPPGSFEPCQIEDFIPLEVNIDQSVSQQIPPDLQPPPGSGPECGPTVLSYGPPPGSFHSQPAQMARADQLLLVTDLGAPVVHRLNVSNPCAIQEEPPLLPASFEQPGRTPRIRTEALAVGPTTTTGQRFAYVVDAGPGGDGTLMVFDLSSSDRTPLIRPHSARSPFEPADRIAFASPVRAVEMVLHDVPIADPATGVAPIGQFCDPDPSLPTNSLGALYRQSADRTTGANPGKLRGIFGLAALANGQIGVIDVEDFDAPCRRPIRANPAPTPNFQGCAGDAISGSYTLDGTATGTRTVTDEASCQVVEQHRPRSGFSLINTEQNGVHAPSLRSFPQLRSPTASTLPTDQSAPGLKNPKLLAVDFDAQTSAVLYVGTNLYQSELPQGPPVSATSRLPTNPATATMSSLTFLLQEPRAFAPSENVTLTYEGALAPERAAGFLNLSGTSANNRFEDDTGGFCGRGVEDLALARQRGSALGLTGTELDQFARLHTDYVQLTAELPGQEDTYWSTPGSVGYTCGGGAPNSGYAACLQKFGTRATPQTARDFVILEAYQDHLMIEPRAGADLATLELAFCCFGAGQATSYVIRGGDQWMLVGSTTAFLHDIVAGPAPAFRCQQGCNPRRAQFKSRALEVVQLTADGARPANCLAGQCLPQACLIRPGLTIPTDSPCVFQNLNTRFAVYRGQAPSQRDMTFVWQYTGGFSSLNISLLTETAAVIPEWMRFVPQIAQLAVADGSSEGLGLVSLESLSVSHFFH